MNFRLSQHSFSFFFSNDYLHFIILIDDFTQYLNLSDEHIVL